MFFPMKKIIFKWYHLLLSSGLMENLYTFKPNTIDDQDLCPIFIRLFIVSTMLPEWKPIHVTYPWHIYKRSYWSQRAFTDISSPISSQVKPGCPHLQPQLWRYGGVQRLAQSHGTCKRDGSDFLSHTLFSQPLWKLEPVLPTKKNSQATHMLQWESLF